MAKKSFNEKLNNAKDLPKVELGKRYFVKDHEKALYQL